MDQEEKNKLIDFLSFCFQQFCMFSRYRVADDAIEKVYVKWRESNYLDEALIKASLINALYGTQVFAIYDIARHIFETGIDKKLLNCGKDEVDDIVKDIRSGHNVIKSKKRKNDKRSFYSFATKYCHWHRPDIFPIYDSIVEYVYRRFNNKWHFREKFSQEDLKDYKIFEQVVEDFKLKICADKMNYREIDHALWVLGKYQKSKLPGEMMRGIKKKTDDLDIDLNFLWARKRNR